METRKPAGEGISAARIGWLLGEIPKLSALGLLAPETAEILRRHYEAQRRAASTTRLVPLVCALLGSFLIGSGIILLLAHNWEEMGHAARAVLSFVPVVLGAALAGFVLWRREESSAWREGAAIFQCLAVGASISLVSQTYHIAGDLPSFLAAWIGLSLPLVYLFGSTGVAALCGIGATVRMGACLDAASASALAPNWLLFLPILPHLYFLLRDGKKARAAWLLWPLGLCLAICLGFQVDQTERHFWPVAFSGLFAAYALLSARAPFRDDSLWLNPLRVLGALGIAVYSLSLTYKFFAREILSASPWASTPGFYICLFFPLAALGLAMTGRRSWMELVVGLFPVTAAAAWGLASRQDLGAALAVSNGYVFVLALSILVDGFRRDRLFHVNAGMALLGILIVSRFFDSDLGFVVRGVADIVVGAGFLTVNYFFLKQRKARLS
jgi:hypothetical protein